MVLLDLEQFKEVDDQHGHATGDRLLRAFGETLAEGLRVDDHAARWEVTSSRLVSRKRARRRSGSCSNVCAAPGANAVPLDVSFFAGIAPLDEDEEARSALERADAALYRSEGRGRDRVAVASELAREVTDGA